MAIRQQVDFTVDVVNGVDDKIRLLGVGRPGCELGFSSRSHKKLVAAIKVRPGRDLLESLAQTMHFWRSYICEGGHGVAVQRRQGDLVEIDDAQFPCSGSGEGGCGMGTYAADSNDDDEGVAEFL